MAARGRVGVAAASATPRNSPSGARPAPARAQEPPQAPILRVEAAAHTAPVARLATDATGRILASVSDDKKTVGQLLKENGVKVTRFVRFSAGA